MAIEIEPRTEVKIKRLFLPSLFLIFSLLIALNLTISFVYFHLSSEEFSKKIKEKEKLLLKNETEKELENKIILYEGKIRNFKKLLSKHKNLRNVFNFIEQISHPDVWFKSFSFETESGSLTLTAETKNLMTVSQQIIILREQKEIIDKINLSNVGMNDKGKVNFSLELTLSPKIFEQ